MIKAKKYLFQLVPVKKNYSKLIEINRKEKKPQY